MGTIELTFNPVLVLVAILLTIMASYTALDLFTLVRSSDRNQRFLFLGASFSLGIGIWMVNFFGTLSLYIGGRGSFQIPIIILALLLGITFSAMSFVALSSKKLIGRNLWLSSFFMTLAVLSIHLISMLAINADFRYQPAILIVAVILVFCSFFFSFWLLFYSKTFSLSNRTWLKPVAAIVVTGAIIEGYLLLTRATIVYELESGGTMQMGISDSFMGVMLLIVAIIIMGGLITSSALFSKRLAESDTNLRDITEALNVSSIVAITDLKGEITYVNYKFVEISKYTDEELLGQNHSILNSGYHSKEFFKKMWSTIRNGEIWKGEICNKAKDGSYYWVDSTIVPFLNGSGKPYQYLAIRNDITERKQSEELLHRQDKLAAVGQLAAGVAHEIRNPLTSMKGYAEFLQLDEEDPERQEFLDIILDEIDRVNNIVEEFMVLAKPKAVELTEENIIPVLKNVLSLLEFEAKKRSVKLHLNVDRDIVQIECDENRLKQVFLNFIKNGIEAMPSGGDLFVKAEVTGDNVEISIKDTGVGISPETLKRIGEPFYTTKKNGNGLGLMVSFKIIESHNGKVYIESEQNKGTTFKILLPAKTA